LPTVPKTADSAQGSLNALEVQPPRRVACLRGRRRPAGNPSHAPAGATALILPTYAPDARYSKVTQATIATTICVKGWTKTIRPPTSYTNALKIAQLREWKYKDPDTSHYEEDHLISLELGGAPRSKRNLWPQPWSQAHRDDNGLEARLHREVCYGTMTVKQARQARHAELVYKQAHR
jgi:hypothetical protein